jgi:hypothetical protein
MAVMVVAVSVWHSWVNDFQPQGRYLFAIFCIISVTLASYREKLNPLAINMFFAAVFVLSVYSYIFVALLRIPKA